MSLEKVPKYLVKIDLPEYFGIINGNRILPREKFLDVEVDPFLAFWYVKAYKNSKINKGPAISGVSFCDKPKNNGLYEIPIINIQQLEKTIGAKTLLNYLKKKNANNVFSNGCIPLQDIVLDLIFEKNPELEAQLEEFYSTLK